MVAWLESQGRSAAVFLDLLYEKSVALMLECVNAGFNAVFSGMDILKQATATFSAASQLSSIAYLMACGSGPRAAYAPYLREVYRLLIPTSILLIL